MLPRKIGEIFERPEQFVVVSLHRGAARVQLQSGTEIRDIALLDLDADVNVTTDPSSAPVRKLVDSNTSVIIELDEAQVLQCEVSLPAETEERLADVIGFEMDRITPFHQDQVYFDFRITKRDKASRTVGVDLAVAPRKIVDKVLGRLVNYGIRPTVISVAGASQSFRPGRSDDVPINLLPPEQRIKSGRRERLMPWLLAVCAIALTAIAIYLPFYQRNNLLQQLDIVVAERKLAAMAAAATRDEINGEIERGNYLYNKRSEAPTILEILNELTLIMPDDTWIARLEVYGTRLSIQGESDNASSLIAIVENARFFKDARFSSPVINNPRSGQDRFALQAELDFGFPDMRTSR